MAKTPPCETTLHSPKSPSKKHWISKKLGESHALLKFWFLENKENNRWFWRVSFLNFQHLFGGCFVANPGEPPKRGMQRMLLHSWRTSVVPRVRADMVVPCFTTMIRWWTTTWYSFSLLLFLAWLSLFWVIIVVVVAAGVAAAVVVFCVRSFQS